MGLLLLNDETQLNPRTLFANNEQGLWLDPSDMNATKAGWRRNLLTYSDEADNAAWTKLGVTVTANQTTTPAGLAADEIISINDGATSNSWLRRTSQAVASGVPVTFSCVVKKTNVDWVMLRMEDTAVSVARQAWFNISNGTKGIVESGVTSDITSLGNGWYRISISFASTVTTTIGYNLALASADGVNSILRNGSNSVYAAQFQAEQSSTPTEYQRITDFSTEFKQAFPTHTLYQDSQGVTPCTAAGDPVGLILDQSRGGLGALGSELVTNGGFDSSTNWQTESNWSIGSGVASASSSSGQWVFTAGYNPAITAGRLYRIEFEIKSISSGSFRAGIWSTSLSTSNVSPTRSVVGKHVVFVTAPSAGNYVVYFDGQSNATGSIDNISIREVPGNHAYQTSSGARPTLARIPSSGRRNLLTRTEEFDNAAWTKLNATVSANSTTAPDGTTTADSFIGSGVANAQRVSQTVTATGSHTFSIYAKANTHNFIQLFQNSDGEFYANFDLSDGTIGNKGTKTTASITSVGSGWYRLVVSWTIVTSGPHSMHLVDSKTSGYAANSATANNLYLWGAQLETGSSATNYQKVVSSSDCTESGTSDLWHLVFDGSDDSLVTNSVDFTGTDEMTVIAGVRKLSDAAIGIVAEHGSTVDTFLAAPRNASPDYGADLRHSGLSSTTAIATYASPISNVVSVLLDRSAVTIGGQVQVRANGVLPSQNNTGTGPIASSNFTNNPLYIGRRATGTLPYNGHLYQLIIRGKTTPTGKLLEAERYTARRTGVTGI